MVLKKKKQNSINRRPTILYIQGSNKPSDQWYIEWNFSKEFESDYKKNYINSLCTEKLKDYIRELNSKCSYNFWTKIIYYASKILIHPFDKMIKKWLRKHIAQKLHKNLENIKNDDRMKFKLWVSGDFKCGAIYLVSSWTISRPQEDRA